MLLFLLKVSAALCALWYPQTFFVWWKWRWGGVPCENGYVIQLSWLIAFCDQFYQQQSAAPLLKQKIPSLLFKRVIFLILPSKMLIVCFTKVDRPGNTHNYWWGNAGFFITSRKKGRTSNHWIFLYFYIKCPWR